MKPILANIIILLILIELIMCQAIVRRNTAVLIRHILPIRPGLFLPVRPASGGTGRIIDVLLQVPAVTGLIGILPASPASRVVELTHPLQHIQAAHIVPSL